VAGLVVAHLLRPGEGEVFQAATDLVPAGAVIASVSKNDGPSIMSGPVPTSAPAGEHLSRRGPALAARERLH